MQQPQVMSKAWMVYDAENGWRIGHEVEHLENARAYGAYHCWHGPGTPTFWRLIQGHWGKPWDAELRDDDGWRSDWPDLIRLEWTKVEPEASS